MDEENHIESVKATSYIMETITTQKYFFIKQGKLSKAFQ